MKKRFIAVVLAVVLCLSLLVLPASAAGGSYWQETYDFLQLAAYQKNGRSLVGTIAWKVSAIPFVRLIDMDQDGKKELLFAINDSGKSYRPSIYGAADANLSVFRWDGKKLVRLDGVPGVLDGSVYSVELSQGNDGKSYFHTNVNGKDSFYGIQSGAITCLDILSQNFQWDWVTTFEGAVVDHSSTGRTHYYTEISGRLQEITQADYDQRIGKFSANGVETLQYDVTRNAGNLSDVIASVAGRVDENYIARYETPSSWAEEGVNDANNHGYVPQALNNRYASPITRAEFCELAVQFFETITGVTITERKSFTDTDSLAVQKLAGRGVINGYGGGLFGPNDLLTREQAAVILSNFAEKCLNTPLTRQYASFTDSSEFSSWAREQVGMIGNAGIMNGVGGGRFDSKGYYTREQSILTIIRMVEYTPLVKEAKITADKTILLAGQSTWLRLELTPTNAVNGTTRWSSDAPTIVTVDSSGRVTANREGTATITAVTTNGTTATYSLTVRPKDYIGLEADLTRSYDFLYQTDSNFYRYGVNYVPDDARIAGSVRVTDVAWHGKSQSSNGVINGTIEVSGVVSAMYDQVYGSGITPYFKWRLMNGSIVIDSGIQKLSVYGSNRDFTVSLSISSSAIAYGNEYRLEFINEEGLSINDLLNDGPEFVPNTPYVISSGYSSPIDYLTIEDIMVDLTYNGRSNTYNAEIFIYGSAELNSSYTRSFSFSWALYDSSNKRVDYSNYARVYSSDIDAASGTFGCILTSSITGLKPGESYRLIFGS